MKRLLVVSSASLLLTACALFPSNFDHNEQARITDTVEWTRDEKIVCADVQTAGDMARTLTKNLSWLQTYSASLPDNEKMSTMAMNIYNIAKDMDTRYQSRSEKAPSVFYCESKIKTINKAARTMLDVSGRRPR